VNKQKRRKEKSTGPPSVAPLQPAKEIRHKGRTVPSLGFEMEKEKEKKEMLEKSKKTPQIKELRMPRVKF
jgi:hypothetical protein